MAPIAALLRRPDTVDAAAHCAATSDLNALRKPTPGQARAGNYPKGRIRVAGLPITIENPAGSRRRPEWPALSAHYGYVRGTLGADGDHVDVFLRPGTPTDWEGPVFVIDQERPDGTFDEHKCMIGWHDQGEAVRAYLANYTPGWHMGPVIALTAQWFRAWLHSGRTQQRLAQKGLLIGLLRKEFTQSASPTSGITAYGRTGARDDRSRRGKGAARMLPGRVSLRALGKWDATQPRDAAGRWTDAGGGDGIGPVAPTEAGMGMAQPAAASAAATNLMAALNADHLQRLGPEAAVALQQIYRQAADAKPGFDRTMTDIADAVGGRAVLPGLKGSDRATEKIVNDYRGDARQIKDVLRATIEVGTVAEAQAALGRIRGSLDVLPSGFRNTLSPDADPVDGYRDIKMNVRVGGVVAEVQINVPALLAVKSTQHVAYEARRSLEGQLDKEGRAPTRAEAATIDRLNAQMKAAYATVWSQISAPPPGG